MVARSPRLNFSTKHGARARSCRTSHAPVKAAPESPLTSIARPSFELRTRADKKARIANGRLDAEWILTKWQPIKGCAGGCAPIARMNCAAPIKPGKQPSSQCRLALAQRLNHAPTQPGAALGARGVPRQPPQLPRPYRLCQTWSPPRLAQSMREHVRPATGCSGPLAPMRNWKAVGGQRRDTPRRQAHRARTCCQGTGRTIPPATGHGRAV